MNTQRKALLLHCGHDGHTRKIMAHIRARIEGRIPVVMHDLRAGSPQDIPEHASVLIAAAIRYGRFHKDLHRYIARHEDSLNKLPSAFLCVCLTARKPEKRSAGSNAYLRRFMANSPWRPTLAEAIAGALLYPGYRWYDRLAIRTIMRMTGGETDTATETIYTDWRQADDFAERFLQLPPPPY